MQHRSLISAVAFVLFAAGQVPAAAQQPSVFEVGVQLAVADLSALGDTDVGFGARFGWRQSSLFGLETELNVYPGDLPDDGPAVSSSRVEALFGATLGPRYGVLRPFARVRPGLLRIQEAPEPIPCIAIFPPPLSCTLAAGKTLLAFDVGGGLEVDAGERTFVRFDLGDRILRYPGPAFESDGTVHSDDFTGHDLRFTIGGGLRF
jgi:hypothetical protein